MAGIAACIRKMKPNRCSVVVAAAGSSVRMGGDKLFMALDKLPVLARTLLTLQGFDCVAEIVIVTRGDKIVETAEICRFFGIDKATKILCGGETRMESVLAGLTEIDVGARLVAVHDGARPLVTEELFEETVRMAALHQCAAPAVPLRDTVKIAEDGRAGETLDRSRLVAVQTPQVFVPELLKGALSLAQKKGIFYTDDCAAVEALGVPVYLTEGSAENIKITTPLDMVLARAILAER
jgi:2-C-methyl-D-erythritol 4-phosphate cytidylyltransferase